ncbi:MAG TPA: phage tail protein [Roseiflexaceae bacterium]|nr:phage tail protein [Roseiflexaceae bacterium]HMP41633.1 phage tail protein [Roseiflexaceae bacterium]
MATGGRTDPLTGYHFYLEIDGITQAQFRECSGLDSESNIIEYKEAGKNGVTIIKKVPGEMKWSNIVLKRGITDIMELWAWRKQVEDGKVNEARKNGSIVLYDQANSEIARWNFVDGWPSKVTGPQLNANNNDIAVEEITICHEGLNRVK